MFLGDPPESVVISNAASTQWVLHVSDKFTSLINKLTHLFNIDLLSNRNQYN